MPSLCVFAVTGACLRAEGQVGRIGMMPGSDYGWKGQTVGMMARDRR